MGKPSASHRQAIGKPFADVLEGATPSNFFLSCIVNWLVLVGLLGFSVEVAGCMDHLSGSGVCCPHSGVYHPGSVVALGQAQFKPGHSLSMVNSWFKATLYMDHLVGAGVCHPGSGYAALVQWWS
jgi:hypothetical protein